jgi:aryl-alcohol dehydrogenase-like predicted oxidoreductase
MQYRELGETGIKVSVLAFGAGPVSTLMVGDDQERQRRVIAHALERGINWFDTAATYGGGQSERSLGRTLEELGGGSQVHLATKVRLQADQLGDIRSAMVRSLDASLERLRVDRVTLLQLHNAITPRRDDEPTSITPEDVLGEGGVADILESLRVQGLVSHVGLTGIGHPESLRQVVNSGRFACIQVPYHLLNPSAAYAVGTDFPHTDYGRVIEDCARMRMGVLGIRVLAGGALADNEPSPHTLTTPFFPLALYQQDRQQARRLRERLAVAFGAELSLSQLAIRFVLDHPRISAALIGFADPWQIDQALAAVAADSQFGDWESVVREVVEGTL